MNTVVAAYLDGAEFDHLDVLAGVPAPVVPEEAIIEDNFAALEPLKDRAPKRLDRMGRWLGKRGRSGTRAIITLKADKILREKAKTDATSKATLAQGLKAAASKTGRKSVVKIAKHVIGKTKTRPSAQALRAATARAVTQFSVR